VHIFVGGCPKPVSYRIRRDDVYMAKPHARSGLDRRWRQPKWTDEPKRAHLWRTLEGAERNLTEGAVVEAVVDGDRLVATYESGRSCEACHAL